MTLTRVAIVLIVAALPPITHAQSKLQTGTPTRESVQHGDYWRYFPQTVSPQSHVMVICHGMFNPEKHDAAEESLGFLKVWQKFADQNGTVLVAPVFDNKNYGSIDGCPQGWGYRGLFGRHVGADEFLHEIINALKAVNKQFDGNFYMFGHSAGGQFAARYVVRHPHRVHTAVISCPAWMPFPNPEVNWPNGMRPRQRTVRWDGEPEDQIVSVVPEKERFLDAAELPMLVTVGALDTEAMKPKRGQIGTNHVERAEGWTKAMNEFAAANGRKGNITCTVVPKVGHQGGTLSRASMRFVATHMRSNSGSRRRSR